MNGFLEVVSFVILLVSIVFSVSQIILSIKYLVECRLNGKELLIVLCNILVFSAVTIILLKTVVVLSELDYRLFQILRYGGKK